METLSAEKAKRTQRSWCLVPRDAKQRGTKHQLLSVFLLWFSSEDGEIRRPEECGSDGQNEQCNSAEQGTTSKKPEWAFV